MSYICILFLVASAILARYLYKKTQIAKTDYDNIFNATTDGIFIHDAATGGILDCNKAACKMMGYEKQDLINKAVSDLSAVELGYTQEKAIEKIIQAATEPEVFPWIAKKSDNTNFWVEVALSNGVIRNENCIIAVFRNIDKRMKAQEQLDSVKGQLEAAIESSVAGIIIADAQNGKFTIANKSAMDILEFDPSLNSEISFADYIRKWPCYDMVGNIIKLEELPLLKAIKHGIISKNHKIKIVIGKNKNKYLSINASPIYDNEGLICGGVVVFLDITEQITIEQALIQNEKMITVGGLAAGMAHEINNPLGAILQGIQNVQRRLSNRDENRKCADDIGLDLNLLTKYLALRKIDKFLDGVRNAGANASTIVNDMLSFVSLHGESKQENDLNLIVEKSISLALNNYDLRKYIEFANIDFIKSFSDGKILISCNKTEIEHVILNIIKNAAFAISHSENSNNGKITIETLKKNDFVEINISDNGKGIDEYNQKHIFEPFFTMNSIGHGVGLGLSVAYFIVTNNHNGRIELESSPGNGARFKVILPLK